MAYISQAEKAKLAPAIKAICKKYNVNASIAVRHHSTLVLNIKQGSIDFIGNFNETVSARPGGFRNGSPAKGSIDVNTHWFHEHFSGAAKDFLEEMIAAMKGPDFFDHSDIQTDYFNLSHYIDINIGQWDRPYALTNGK